MLLLAAAAKIATGDIYASFGGARDFEGWQPDRQRLNMDCIVISARRSIGNVDDAVEHLVGHRFLYWSVKFPILQEKFEFPMLALIHRAGASDWDKVEYQATIDAIIPFNREHYEGNRAYLFKPKLWLNQWSENIGGMQSESWKNTLVMTKITPFHGGKITSLIKYRDGKPVSRPPQNYIRVVAVEDWLEETPSSNALRAPGSVEELRALEAKYANDPPEMRERISRHIERGPMGEKVKQLCDHKCQICAALGKSTRTFKKKNGEWYSEAHHVQFVSSGKPGVLSPSNIIVLCPNHHRQLHYGGIEHIDDTDAFSFELPDGTVRIEKILL